MALIRTLAISTTTFERMKENSVVFGRLNKLMELDWFGQALHFPFSDALAQPIRTWEQSEGKKSSFFWRILPPNLFLERPLTSQKTETGTSHKGAQLF